MFLKALQLLIQD